MKKSVLAAALAICAIFALASCGKAPEAEKSFDGDGAPSGAIELPLIDPDN